MNYRQKTKKPSSHSKMAPKSKTNMRGLIRGVFFCSFWYLSIIAGFFVLICPILPLVVISPKNYRKWSDLIFGMWEPFPVAMMEVCFGIRVVLSGDKINPFEGSLFIMNHRTRVDWNFLWLGLFHCCQPNAHNMKYILKAPLMHVPGPGWVMQTCSFIFIHRDWKRDKKLLENLLDYLNESDRLYQVLIFPEGTDLTENNIQKSHKYADENNLERYYRVLHPRTTGFAYLVQKMKSGGQLNAVYDVTVAYPKTMPQTEADLLRGQFPEEVHFHVKRHSSSTIPFQENELKIWLTNIWQEKEKQLQRFYTSGYFTNQQEIDSFAQNSEQKIDYGKMSMKNGLISYKHGETSQLQVDQLQNAQEREISVESIVSAGDPKPSVSAVTNGQNLILANNSQTSQDHMNCDNIFRSKNYRPSHLLYLVLTFWFTLIALTIYGLFYNFYLQLWVLTHSLLFLALSFVSNGFHHVAAAIYFYRHKKKTSMMKKKE